MEISEIKVSYSSRKDKEIQITNSEELYELVISHWDKDIIEYQEEVKLVLLNRASNILGIFNLSKGGTSSAVVDIKIILAVALKCNSSSLAIVHNHPSGNLIPSHRDKEITKKLKRGCEYVDLKLIDHLIISKDSYYSFKVNDLL